MEYLCHDSMKFFTALMKFDKKEKSHAEQILHTIACSTDYIDWHAETMEAIINKRVLRGSNIVDLVQYLLYTGRENRGEPHGLQDFVEALKRIRMESRWVLNKTIASELNEYASSDNKIDENTD